MEIYSQEDRIMENIIKFYKKKKNLNILLNILNKKTNISLRLIDWYVINYSSYNDDLNRKYKKDLLYYDYKSQLIAYHKKDFDPFCRYNRIKFCYSKNKHIETTVGQLNFIKWIIQENILKILEDNYEELQIKMNNDLYKKKGRKKKFECG